MEFRALGPMDLRVTELCFGLLPLGPLQKNLDEKSIVSLLQHALSLGINFFDTAELYGTQEYLGKALKGWDRSRVVVATKSAATTYEDMRRSVEKSLVELRTDYIDIYHLHASRETATVFASRAGAIGCLSEYKSKGRIRAIGVSTHSVAVVEAAAKRNDIDVVFPIINKAGRGIQDGSREEMEAAIRDAAGAGKGVYAMKALAGGHLVSDVPSSINYVRSLPGISAVAVGMVNEQELLYNVELFTRGKMPTKSAGNLSREQKRVVIMGFCKGCGTCARACPNLAITVRNGRAQVDPTKCILCGYCNPVCPEFAIRVV